jgi:hypothetical protein
MERTLFEITRNFHARPMLLDMLIETTDAAEDSQI